MANRRCLTAVTVVELVRLSADLTVAFSVIIAIET